jgi:hypothetical protein
MKVMGCGQLSDDPARAVQFVLNLGCVDAIVLGMEDESEVDRNLELIVGRERQWLVASD